MSDDDLVLRTADGPSAASLAPADHVVIAFAADPFSTSHVRERSAAFARHTGPQRVASTEVQRAALRISAC